MRNEVRFSRVGLQPDACLFLPVRVEGVSQLTIAFNAYHYRAKGSHGRVLRHQIQRVRGGGGRQLIQLRMFKNGRVDLKFKTASIAKEFAETYLDYSC